MLLALSDAAAGIYVALIVALTTVSTTLLNRPVLRRIRNEVQANGGDDDTLADRVLRIEQRQDDQHHANEERFSRLERYTAMILRQIRSLRSSNE